MRSIPSFSGLAIIFFKKGFTSVLTVMRVFVFCSSIATSCIHKNRGMGEFSAVNLMVLFGSRITTRKVSSPTGSTDMVHESASNRISFICCARSWGIASRKRLTLFKSDKVAYTVSVGAGICVMILSNGSVLRSIVIRLLSLCRSDPSWPGLYAIVAGFPAHRPRYNWFRVPLRAWHCSCPTLQALHWLP